MLLSSMKMIYICGAAERRIAENTVSVSFRRLVKKRIKLFLTWYVLTIFLSLYESALESYCALMNAHTDTCERFKANHSRLFFCWFPYTRSIFLQSLIRAEHIIEPMLLHSTVHPIFHGTYRYIQYVYFIVLYVVTLWASNNVIGESYCCIWYPNWCMLLRLATRTLA